MRTTYGLAGAAAMAVAALGAVAATWSARVPATEPPRPGEPDPSATTVLFEANRGQVDDRFAFVARARGYTALIGAGETALLLPEGDRVRVLGMRVEGASDAAGVRGSRPLASHSNYLRGRDESAWVRGVPHYAEAVSERVLSGVDVRWRAGRAGALRYDVEIAPGARPGSVVLSFEGAEAVRLEGGDLVVETGGGTVRHSAPVAYQDVSGTRAPIAARFVLRGPSSAGFALGAYDERRPVVIDPTIEYLTHLGGSGFDIAGRIAVDANGAAFVVGQTSSADFPLQGPLQGTKLGLSDAFVSKLSPDGTSLVYSTYIGGSGTNNRAWDVAVDAAGRAVVVGNTKSSDFPLVNAFQSTYGGISDGFVLKLDAAGAALVFSTFLGGTGNTSGMYAVAVDSQDAIHVGGYTYTTDFPTMSPLQAQHGGGTDGVVTKFTPDGSTLVYSTFLGGLGFESVADLDLGADDGVYVTGGTSSPDFPVQSPFQASKVGGTDVFVSRLTPDGQSLVYSTYVGGALTDLGSGIAVEASGAACVVGNTRSVDFPTQSPNQGTPAGPRDAFVFKLSPPGAALVFSTYLGIPTNDSAATGVDAGPDGLCHVIWHSVEPAVPPQESGFGDVLVDAFDAAGTSIDSVTIGGSEEEFSYGIDVTSDGTRYALGTTQSTDLPVTPGAFQATNLGDRTTFVARLVPAGSAIGDGLLYASRANFVVNHAKHGRGKPSDGVTLRGCLNPNGAAADLSAATATVTINGTDVISALPLNARGVGKTARGVAPGAKVSFKQRNGALAVTLRKADLRTALGFADEDATSAADVEVEVTIAGAGLVTPTAHGTLRCGLRSRTGKSAKAAFKFGANDVLEGAFKALRTTVSERAAAHRVSIRAALAAPGGEALTPVDGLTVTIGDAAPLVVPQASLSFSGTRATYSRALGEVAGLLRLQLDAGRRQLTLSTDDLAVGLPAAGGGAATAAALPVRVEVELAAGSVVFGTTVEVLRKSGTSKRWAR